MSKPSCRAVISGVVSAGLAVIVAAPSASAAGHHATVVTRRMPGGRRLPVAARTVANAPGRPLLVGRVRATAPVRITVAFRPADPALLARLARNASGRPGLPISVLRRLVAPSRGLVAATSAYLRGYGFRHESGGILTQTYVGTASGADHAFGTELDSYTSGRVAFRSPSRPASLPSFIAVHVQAVDGLDTYPLARAMFRRARTEPQRHAAPVSCPNAAAFPTGYQPGDLAGTSAYDFQSLLDASHDGSGEVLDLLEFTSDVPADVTTYQTCYGTGVPVSVESVAGGTTTQSGAVEEELDDEVAATAAPGLDHIYNYQAPISAGWAAVIDRMLTDAATTGVTEISISWGACEKVFPPFDVASSDNEFQLAAAAGISVYAASGDSGASSCQPFTNSIALNADYPASDPYVTAVGGTTLDTSAGGANREVSWGTPFTGSGGGGGGGVSALFPMPSWQTGTGVIEPSYSSMTPCARTTQYCREFPDVSLDANPDSGYIVYCTNPSPRQCGGAGWLQMGGTSAAAPLMAAITADANTYSLANGGGRLGFASPFLYSELGTSMYRDVTVGSNAIQGATGYPAGAGYDMSTGLGAPDGALLAQDLAAATAGSLSFDDATLSSTESRKAIAPSRGTVLSGTLTDATTAQPLAGRLVCVEGVFKYGKNFYELLRRVVTDSNGAWSTTVGTTSDPSRMQWVATYPGEEAIAPAVGAVRTLYVRPSVRLKSPAGLRIPHGDPFSLWGYSNPRMRGATFHVQYRSAASHRWHTSTVHVKAGSNGRFETHFRLPSTGTLYVRFHYQGSKTTQWLSVVSNAKKVIST